MSLVECHHPICVNQNVFRMKRFLGREKMARRRMFSQLNFLGLLLERGREKKLLNLLAINIEREREKYIGESDRKELHFL